MYSKDCRQTHHVQLAADTHAKLCLSGDLLALDFNVPDDAPAEFRSLSYGSRQARLAPGAGKVMSTPTVCRSTQMPGT